MARLSQKLLEDNPLGLDEIEELDQLAEAYLDNCDEIVTLSVIGGRDKTVSITRRQVYKLASTMSSNAVLADMLNIDVNTLTARFKKELKMARAFARQKLTTRFYHLALYGSNPADRIFALKNWTNMSDAGLTETLEDTMEGSEFIIRRPQLAALNPSSLAVGNNNHEEVVEFDPEVLENAKNSV